MLKRIKSVLKRTPDRPQTDCQCEEEAKQSDRDEVEQTVQLQETRLRELMNRVDQDLSAGLSFPATSHRR